MDNNYLQSLKKGFKKTSNFIRSGIHGLFSGGRKSLSEDELENMERIFIEADLGVDFSFQLIEDLRDEKSLHSVEEVRKFIKEKILKEFKNSNRNLKNISSPHVILFIGINGSGKTTTIAKMAKKLKNEGNKILLCASDTFRAAAIEQLTIWSDRLELPIVKHKMGADPAAVAHDACERAKARNYDYVLIDTAGRLHNQNSLMEELKKIVRIIKARLGEGTLESLLVIDGNGGQNSFVQAQNFKETIGVDGIAITKLDGTAKGGIVVSIEKELSIPVKFVGVGEKMDDLIPFEPEAFVEALLKSDE